MNPPLKKKMKKHEDITLQFFIIFLFRFRVHHFTERKHSEKEKEHLIAKRKKLQKLHKVKLSVCRLKALSGHVL